MRLADWDGATTAQYRALWEQANRAHKDPEPVLPTEEPTSLSLEELQKAIGDAADEAGEPAVESIERALQRRQIHKAQKAAASAPERRRRRVLNALADLLSTQPPILPPERLLRTAVLKHCALAGQPLPDPSQQGPLPAAVELVVPPEDRMRATWARVDAMAARLETTHGPLVRLAPFLERLRAHPEPSDELLMDLWAEAVAFIQREPENPVLVRVLRYFDGERNRAESYRTFELPKRRGGTRTITTPRKSLKWLQRSLLQVLTHLFPRHTCAVGFERGESVVSHARAHAGKRWVYVLDIQDFFPSITRSRIYGMLRAKPFEASEPVARYLANLATHDGALPQGAPTSPILANLLCRRMDARLFKWARERGYQYSRYADDLAFSTNRADFPEADREQIAAIVEGEGFTVHPDKQKLMPWYGRQLVTGLVVNEKPNVPREYVRGLRALLFNVETFGWASQVGRTRLEFEGDSWLLYKRRAISLADFQKVREQQRETHALVRPGAAIPKATNVRFLQRIVRGRIAFVGAVKGKESPVYLRLREQYDRLVGRERATTGAVREGRKSFVPETVEVPVEAKGNYADFKALEQQIREEEATPSDLYAWVERRASWSLEADWLLRRFADLDEDERLRQVRDLAYTLDTHPAQTAAFFRQFRNGRPFRRLLHDPMVAPDARGRFHFPDGTVQSAAEIVGACEAALRAAPLPNPLKTETNKVLRECQDWLELHPQEHPFVSDKLHDRLQTYKWEVRYDDEKHSDLWGRLQTEAATLRERGGVVEVDEDLPVFYTYTPNVTGQKRASDGRPERVGAVIRLLRSLVDKAIKKADGGPVQPVRVSATYERVAGTEQAVVVLQATDGPVRLAPGLANVLRGDTQDALYDVRGLARWTMEVPYADGSVRAYDVTQNTEVSPLHTVLPGFRHVLTFYQ